MRLMARPQVRWIGSGSAFIKVGVLSELLTGDAEGWMVGSVTLSGNLLNELKAIRELLHTQRNAILPNVESGLSDNLTSWL